MARGSRKTALPKHEFANKLLLSQWLISLFGIDPLADGYKRGERPFHKLVEHLRVTRDFMMKFKEYLKSEGLPGNEKRRSEKIPLNVTYDFGKKLKIVRPKVKKSDGHEYDFKKDAPVPSVQNAISDWIKENKVVCDWYPRVQGVISKVGTDHQGRKNKASLHNEQIAMLDFTELYFELERFKRERTWHNFNVTEDGLRKNQNLGL